MQYQQYQVNAFTRRPFGGNPAAVVVLEEWLDAPTMLAIAAENNLSETAFYVPQGERFGLRWFTPTVEVELCGHATLATAHVLFEERGYAGDTLRFETRYSGELTVSREAALLAMNFPLHPVTEVAVDPAVAAALGGTPVQAFEAPSRVYVYATEAEVRALSPDLRALLAASDRPVIVTAPGETADFVSRFFGPQVGVDEDPATGSAHCALTPLWAQRLGRDRLRARQVSARGGDFDCERRGERVILRGSAVTFLRGTIDVP